MAMVGGHGDSTGGTKLRISGKRAMSLLLKVLGKQIRGTSTPGSMGWP